MKIDSFHRFLTFRTAACMPTKTSATGSKIVPIMSIHLKPNSRTEKGLPPFTAPRNIPIP
jgi:hypothetical protein